MTIPIINDDTPLTPEEIAERDKVPTFGGDIFEHAIDQNGVLGDSLIDTEEKPNVPTS